MSGENNVLIFNAPLYRTKYDDGEDYLPPLGLGYIVTQLRNNGIQSSLIDCVYERLGIDEVLEIINKGNFSYVGFNVFSINLQIIKEILSGIKKTIHVLLGGKAIEYLWEEIVSYELHLNINFVIGEAELILPDIIKGTCNEVPIYKDELNKVYRINKNSRYYPNDLDSICLDRIIFKNREILNKFGKLEGCLIASRGCIYECTFCGGSRIANPLITPRIRSIQSLEEEINQMVKISNNLESIRILDDLFIRGRSSIINAIDLFNKFPKLSWRCMAHVNSFINNLDLIPMMEKSGCEEIFIGIESGSEIIRKAIKKVGTVNSIKTVITSLLEGSINVKGYFICGFPEETENQVLETVNLANFLYEYSLHTPGKFRATAFQFRPYHGTEIYDEIISSGTNCKYSHLTELVSAKQQYNFTAGNFSLVDDKTLNKYIQKINSLGV